MSALSILTSVVSSKSASVVRVVDDVQVFAPKRIHLDDLEVEFLLGDIPLMSRRHQSRPTLPVVGSSFASKTFSQKPPLTLLSKLNLSVVDCIRKLQFRK